MFWVAAALLSLATALVLVRAARGPSVFDRLLAANSIGTLAMLLLLVLGFLGDRPEFVDLALVYGLLNAIGTVAVLRYLRRGETDEPVGP
ncbi:MAG: K+/H+ antiporter subunit F [Xanthomonadales bacterium]|nr:K+/H+ antiporter subunit F [Xanthomonadales bacterium]